MSTTFANNRSKSRPMLLKYEEKRCCHAPLLELVSPRCPLEAISRSGFFKNQRLGLSDTPGSYSMQSRLYRQSLQADFEGKDHLVSGQFFKINPSTNFCQYDIATIG